MHAQVVADAGAAPLHLRHAELRAAREAERVRAAGLEVVDFPPLAYTDVDGTEIAASYLNFYICDGGVIVPVAGDAQEPRRLRLGRQVGDLYAVGCVLDVLGTTLTSPGRWTAIFLSTGTPVAALKASLTPK